MKRGLSIFIALNLLGIGINFVLQAGFGCDAITMINEGIARFLHTNYTIAGIVYNTIFIVMSLLFAKDLLGWGTICYAYGTGVFIDVYQNLLASMHLDDASLMFRVFVLIIGQLMMCFAFAMLIERNLGRSALDAVLTRIVERFHISYRVLKTICDVMLVIVAYVLGATFGVGTIVCVITGGIVIQAYCKLLSRKKVDNI